MFTRFFGFNRRPFSSLSEQEILALAISSEEDDARIYRAYADGLRDGFPQSAKVFDEMAEEEDSHRDHLIEAHRKRFGETIPLIRREHVRGYYERKPDWLVRPLGLERVRDQAEAMESQAHRYYLEAAKRTADASTRKLLNHLATAEKSHVSMARRLGLKHLTENAREEENQAERRRFILTYVQPGLAGLMDGSVSTLAPIFAAAFATHDTWQTFLVGLAASIGAGISMGFTEVASDDGVISGRGSRSSASRHRDNDHGRRAWPRAAISDLGFLDRDDDRDRNCLCGIVGHRLDPEPVDGNAMEPGDLSGRAGRRACFRRRHADRECLIPTPLVIAIVFGIRLFVAVAGVTGAMRPAMAVIVCLVALPLAGRRPMGPCARDLPGRSHADDRRRTGSNSQYIAGTRRIAGI